MRVHPATPFQAPLLAGVQDLCESTPPPRSKRHCWPPAGAELRDVYITTRICLHCGIRRITHHEGGRPWIEWQGADGVRLDVERTPACEPAEGGDT
jgi:hypothetical protein